MCKLAFVAQKWDGMASFHIRVLGLDEMNTVQQADADPGPRERVIELAGGIRIGLADYGAIDGAPVLALHGAPSSRLMFAPADEPARRLGLRLIAPERPGYGLSPPEPRANGLAAQTRLIRELADALGLERFGLLGVSGGGPYAAAAAADLGRRVSALALVSPVGLIANLAGTPWLPPGHRWFFCELPKKRRLFAVSARLAARLFRAAPSPMVSLVAGLIGGPDRIILGRPRARQAVIAMTLEALKGGAAGGIADMDVYGAPWPCELSRITAPSRLWQGTEDAIVPVAASIALSRAIPGCRLSLLEGAGHFWVLDHMDDVLAALRDMMTAGGEITPGS